MCRLRKLSKCLGIDARRQRDAAAGGANDRSAFVDRVLEAGAERLWRDDVLVPLRPNIGKTALVEEFLREVRTTIGPDARITRGQCEAVQSLTRALELVATLPDGPERAHRELLLRISLGTPRLNLRGFGAPEVQATYARALEICRHVGETPQLFPVLAGVHAIRTYRGFRPYTPDHLPVIGADPRVPGLLHACGHEGAGVGLAPATAELVTAALTETTPPVDAHPFRPDRFGPDHD